MAILIQRLFQWWSAAPVSVAPPVDRVAQAYLTYGPRVAREIAVRARAESAPKPAVAPAGPSVP